MNKPDLNFPLINAHTHASMIAFRGLAEDIPLEKWLAEYIWPAEKKKVNPKFVFKNTQEAVKEMKANGIKAFCNMYFFEEEVAKVCKMLNMKVVLGEAILDFPTPSAKCAEQALVTTEKLIKKYKNDKLISVSVSVHAIYSASKETLLKSSYLAKKHNCIFQIHLAETAMEVKNCYKRHKVSPIEYLDALNILNERSLLIHCVHVTDSDIQIMADRKVNVAHCPLSNLKLGSGIAPVDKMMSKGINVALGTDSAASSNRLDIWEAGKFAALVQKGVKFDPTVISSKEAVEMMSLNGMKALGIDKIEGKKYEQIKQRIERKEKYDELFYLNF